MDLRNRAQCGEAYLALEGTCLRYAQVPPSIQNTGMKTALLLGLLSVGIPSQGGAGQGKIEQRPCNLCATKDKTLAFSFFFVG